MSGGDKLDLFILSQPFFAGVTLREVEILTSHATVRQYPSGGAIFREGGPADEFHLIRHGTVALELYVPGRGPIVCETLQESEVLGWSWIIAPYRWSTTARAVDAAETVCFDAVALRDIMQTDHAFGYRMLMRFMPVVSKRLSGARLQILDFYGEGAAS